MRKKQFAGSAPTFYIFVDGAAIAALEVGPYTTFPVANGQHSIGVTWRVGDKVSGIGGAPAGGVMFLEWSPYLRAIDAECIPPKDHFFAVPAKPFPLKEENRVEIVEVEALRDDFATERNVFVVPGPSAR